MNTEHNPFKSWLRPRSILVFMSVMALPVGVGSARAVAIGSGAQGSQRYGLKAPRRSLTTSPIVHKRAAVAATRGVRAPEVGVKRGAARWPETRLTREVHQTLDAATAGAGSKSIARGRVGTSGPAKRGFEQSMAPATGRKSGRSDASDAPADSVRTAQASAARDMSYAVYAEVTNVVEGVDADGDGYLETFEFDLAVDADAWPWETVQALIICTTTGQMWWSDAPWTVFGGAFDYRCFYFTEADFDGWLDGPTTLEFVVELWDWSETFLLAVDEWVSGSLSVEPLPQYAVYGTIDRLYYGVDADGDGYYEQFSFEIGVDVDASYPTTVHTRIICDTTGQSWWSDVPWTVSGTATDYRYLPFDDADFAEAFTGNAALHFTVEVWDASRTWLLVETSAVAGAPVPADDYEPPYHAVYATIAEFVGGHDADADGYFETFSFDVAIDADAIPDADVHARIVCETTGQEWWSSSPWTASGAAADYRLFGFDETDFDGVLTESTGLEFRVELWDIDQAYLLASTDFVLDEPVLVEPAAADWELRLAVTGAQVPEMSLGVVTGAGDVYDPGIDVFAVPPAPGVGYTVFRAVDDVALVSDYRADVDGAVWLLCVTPSSTAEPVVLSWDRDVAAVQGLLLVEVDGEEDEAVPDGAALDMAREGVIVVDGAGTRCFHLIGGLTTFDLRLHSGWNLVSVPLAPADGTVEGVFGGAIVSAAWTWDEVAGEYVAAEAIEPSRGYWVYCSARRGVATVTVVGHPVRDLGIDFRVGWNLVGPVELGGATGLDLGLGDGVVALAWNGAEYVEVAGLEAGRGYWVYGELPR